MSRFLKKSNSPTQYPYFCPYPSLGWYGSLGCFSSLLNYILQLFHTIILTLKSLFSVLPFSTFEASIIFANKNLYFIFIFFIFFLNNKTKPKNTSCRFNRSQQIKNKCRINTLMRKRFLFKKKT